MTTDIDKPHEEDTTIHQDVIYPAHDKRTESHEFVVNKHLLVEKLDTPCWVCGSKENREVHHWVEWSLFPAIDPAKMQQVLKLLDVYGYSHSNSASITSPDDIRNLVVLCEKHHRAVDNGVHSLTFPIWIALKCLKDGIQITEQVHVVKAADKSLEK